MSGNKAVAYFLPLFLLAAFIVGIITTRHLAGSFWLDEVHTVRIAKENSLSGVLERTRESRPYPPLYFIIAHYAYKGMPSEFGLRLPSVIFGFLATLSLFLLAKKLFDPMTGLLAGAFFLLNTKMIFCFRDANAYALLAFLIILSVYFLYRSIRSGRKEDWVAYCIFALASLATHAFALFYIAAQIFAAWVLAVTKPGCRHSVLGIKTQTLLPLLAVSSVITLGGIFWTFYLLAPHDHAHPNWSLHKFSPQLFLMELKTLYGWGLGGPFPVNILFPLLIASGVLSCLRSDKRKMFFIGTLLVVPAVFISFITAGSIEYPVINYGVGLFPLLCVLAASNVFGLIESGRLHKKFFPIISIILMGAYLCLAWVDLRLFTRNYSTENFRETAFLLRDRASCSDLIITYPPYYNSGFDYYYKPCSSQAKIPFGSYRHRSFGEVVREAIHQNQLEKGKVFIVLSKAFISRWLSPALNTPDTLEDLLAAQMVSVRSALDKEYLVISKDLVPVGRRIGVIILEIEKKSPVASGG